MLNKDTEELASRLLAHVIGGWAASGRPLPTDARAEANMCINYARSFEQAV